MQRAVLFSLLLNCAAEQPRSRSHLLEVGPTGDLRRPFLRSQVTNDQSQKLLIQSSKRCLAGLQSRSVCCPSRCQTCGGPICSLLAGGSENCCFANILQSNRECSADVGAPCVVPEGKDPKSECDGIPSIPACCPDSCEVCGGPACSNRPGGSESCCHRAIVGSGRSCSDDVGPPCAMFDDSLLHPPPTMVATTATTTSTTTTTTTVTTTRTTVTTSTVTVTTTTSTETSSTSSTATSTSTTTRTLPTTTTTTLLTSSWTPWVLQVPITEAPTKNETEVSPLAANMTNSSSSR
mmetsp:Transcript_49368/g.107540  ORF Transcript_49368/g.107540 Transcript_49368/m.107540 type:complete len:293 (-) Transcript_49368:89-967(-)